MTIEELYEEQVKQLPAAERLRLATLILNDIPPQSFVDYQDEWSGDDLHDFRVAGLRRVDAAVGGTEDA